MCVCVCVRVFVCLPNPSARLKCNMRLTLKSILKGLTSKYSLSQPCSHTKVNVSVCPTIYS